MSTMAKKRKTKRTTRPKGKHKRAKVTPCDVAGCTSKAGSKCQHCHACMCEGHVAAGYVCCSATGGESANPPRYLGPIKSKKGAEALANRLDRVGTDEATGAAEQLRRSWQYVAARPELGQSMEALAGVVKLSAKEKKALKEADARVERASRAYHSDFAYSPDDAARRQRDYDLALRERDALRRPVRTGIDLHPAHIPLTPDEQRAHREVRRSLAEPATFDVSYGTGRRETLTVPAQPSAGDVARALGHDPVITGEAGSRMGRAGRCLRCGAAGYEVFNEGCPGPAVTLHAQRMVELAQETARERRQQLAASEAMLGTASTPAVASVGGILLDRAARGRLQAEARAFGHVFVDDGRNCARCGQSASEAIEGTCVGSARSRAGRLSLNQQTSAGFRSMAETQGHQVSMRDATDLSNGIDGAACFNCAMRGPSLSNHRCPAATTEVFPVAAPAWAPPPPPVAALAGTGVERLAGSIAAERIVAPSRATPEWVGRMSAQPEAIAERAAAEAARLQRAAEFRARGARPAGVPAPRPYVPAPGGAERFRGLEFDPGAPVQHDPATEAGAERFRGLELWNPVSQSSENPRKPSQAAAERRARALGHSFQDGRCTQCWCPLASQDASRQCAPRKAWPQTVREVRRNGPTFDRPGYPFADKQAMYADMDTGSLQWSWADAIMARDASMGWNAVGETWYQDDASTIGDELRRRGAALGEEHLRAMKNREWRAQQAALAERYAKEQHAAAYAAPGAERFKGLELDRPRAYGEGAGGAERFRGLELSNPGDADLRALEREILSGHAYGMPQDHEQIERLNDMRQRYGLGRWDRARITQHQSPKYKSKWKGDHDWTTKAKALASVTRPRLFVDAILVDEIAYAPGSWDTVLLKRYLVANDRAGAEAAQRAHMAAFEKLSPSDKIARMTMNNPFFAPPALQYVAFANPPTETRKSVECPACFAPGAIESHAPGRSFLMCETCGFTAIQGDPESLRRSVADLVNFYRREGRQQNPPGDEDGWE